MIHNAATDPTTPLIITAASMGRGGALAIEEQERAGHAQLLHSDQLPADMGDRASYEALGFTFGDPTPGDPLFVQATLPDGWKRQAGSDARGSDLVDEFGRRRVSIFYKAAFYDRQATMTLIGVQFYVYAQVNAGAPIVTDPIWAVPEAVHAALLALAAEADERITVCARIAEDRGDPNYQRDRIEKATADRDRYTAVAAQFAPPAAD